jgi:hypothetical protein
MILSFDCPFNLFEEEYILKNAVLWDVRPCRSCVNRRFGETYRLHLQGRKSASEDPAWAGGCRLLTLVPRSRIFLPWRWRRYVPPKRRFTQDLHDATSQKTTFFIVTVVKTSNLTRIHLVLSFQPAARLNLQLYLRFGETGCNWTSVFR